MSSMHKVFINAYTYMNLGDDLFIEILCKRYPEILFYIPKYTFMKNHFLDFDNVKAIVRIRYIDGLLNKMKLNISINDMINRIYIKYCSATITIGGSLFIESEGWEKKYINLRKMLRLKPSFIIGCNFGPYQSNSFYNAYKELFRSQEDICFRDQHSLNLFADLKNTRKCNDIVFTLPCEDISYTKKSVVISIIDLNEKTKLTLYKNEYESFIRKLTKLYISNNYKITFMSFCQAEGDVNTINSIIEGFSEYEKKYISQFLYNGDTESALKEIKQCEIIIATRFHAMILGLLYRKKTLPIIYSSKTRNVINDIKFPNICIDIEDIGSANVSEVYNQLKSYIPFNTEDLIKDAQHQFEFLDKYFNK